jgi:hypothetical protein
LTDITIHETGAAGMAEGGAKWWWCNKTWVAQGKKKGLIGGVHMSVIGKRENDSGEGHNPAEKVHSAEDAQGMRANWVDEGGAGYRGRSGRCGGLGWLGRIPEKIQMRI